MTEFNRSKPSPEDLILDVFSNLKIERLQLPHLILVADVIGKLTPETTQSALKKLVTEGMLGCEGVENDVWFFIPKTPKEKVI